MLSEETKRWFQEKISQNPEYISRTFLPMLEKTLKKSDDALRESIRRDGIEQMKYRMGWSDGVQHCCAILDGLRISEGRSPAAPGLMERIFSKRSNDLSDIPSGMG